MSNYREQIKKSQINPIPNLETTAPPTVPSSDNATPKADFELCLKKFLDGAQAIYDNYMQKNFPGQSRHFERMDGPKYVKIVTIAEGAKYGSAYCFIEKATGNIFKAASFNAPAKNIRGNIFDADNGLKNIGPYGPAYMKDMKANYRGEIEKRANLINPSIQDTCVKCGNINSKCNCPEKAAPLLPIGLKLPTSKILYRDRIKRTAQLGGIFDPDNASQEMDKLRSEIKAPFVNLTISTLGGKERATIMISLSLDPKESWINNIFQNSRFMYFKLGRNGELDQFTRAFDIKKKFKKAKIHSIDDAIIKINQYLSQI